MTPGAHALAHGAGIVALEDDGVCIAAGDDARDFLHRMLTQDIRSLRAGETRRACFLDTRGRIHLDLLVREEKFGVIAMGEPRPTSPAVYPMFMLFCDRLAAERSVPTLERYILADKVRFLPWQPGLSHWWVVGERAEQVLADAADAASSTGPKVFGGVPAIVFRRDLGPRPGFRVGAWQAVQQDTRPRVLAALREAGAVDATRADFDQARVETGTPWWGSEIDDRVMPTEAGLVDAVSFTKGCYLGQEPVTMSKHRGHPPTLLCRFTLGAGASPPAGTALLEGERRVGRLTTVVPGMALGYLAFASAKQGATFTIEGGDAPASVERVLA